MKKSFSLFKGAAFNKLGFLPFLMTFLFFAAMQVDMKAQASSTLPSSSSTHAARVMFTPPSGPFVTVPVAQDRLITAMKLLKDQLANLTEGTAPFKAAHVRVTYYSYINANLEAGKGVSESIVAGLAMVYSDLKFGMTPDEAVAEKNAAINLLKL